MDTDHIQDDITPIENNEESEKITDSSLEEDVSTEVSSVVYELITIAEQNAQREGDINEFLRHYKFAGNLATDSIGRTHIRRPTTGSTILTLHSQIFHSSTAQSHANDLLPILRADCTKDKSIVMLKVDNDPDWSIASLSNNLYYMRLWRDANLDFLLLQSHAARYSAYNNIEHLWSPVSKRFTSAILPAILNGDNTAPCHFEKARKEERKDRD